jgi:tetratricopeptide (TPR) repeat protein
MAKLLVDCRVLKVVVLLTFVLTFGCMSSKNEWKSVEGPTETGNTSALIAKANRQTGEADSKEKILELIHNYESVLRIDPADYEALWSLGSYYSLVGMAYPDNMYEKESYYKKAMQCCERAMYTNPDFRGLIAQGEEPWEACGALSKREIEAMYYWYTAAGAYWSECLGRTGKLLNRKMPSRLYEMMKRIGEVDPSWEEGRAYYAKAVYYSILSDFYGGDLKKAAYFFKRCIKEGPDRLSRRWGRAKYLYTRKDNRKGFQEDLEWVIAQDPKSAKGPYPWNVCFQRDAKKMLSEIEDYF